MHIHSTTFQLNTQENQHHYMNNISENIIVHMIERFKPPLTILYFTNELFHRISIPNNIVIYEYDYPNKKLGQILLKLPNIQSYDLCCGNNYEIHHNNKLVLTIHSQHTWQLTNV